MILLELFMYELREFLLLLDLNGSVKGVHVTLYANLLHMKIEHLFVRHVVVTHVDSLTEFTFNVW